MSLTEYFEQGRQQERDHARKVKARTPQRRYGAKPSAFSPSNLIIGAGVLFEIVYPKISPFVSGMKPRIRSITEPISRSISGDIQTIVRKIRGANPGWEDYQQFLELARRK